VNGRLIYQGSFLPYEGEVPVPEGQLLIDPETTSQNGPELVSVAEKTGHSSHAAEVSIPLLFLRDGNVLIPANAYEKGRARLDEKRFFSRGVAPKRPSNVAATAVYVPWIPSNFGGPPNGVWISCWYVAPQNADMCRIATTQGKGYYEGPFVPDSGRGPLPESELTIDTKATSVKSPDDFTAGSQNGTQAQPLPFLYLRSGEILLPAQGYEAAKQYLAVYRR
jgi:hypothetical protein